jgi:hypothetical protein
MSDEDLVLDRIVELKGNCLDAKLCSRCPFAKKCLPAFMRAPYTRPSKEQRLNMALDHITRRSLLDDQSVHSKNEEY